MSGISFNVENDNPPLARVAGEVEMQAPLRSRQVKQKMKPLSKAKPN